MNNRYQYDLSEILQRAKLSDESFEDIEEFYDSLRAYDAYLASKNCLNVSLCDIVYGYTFSGDKWLNSIARDRTTIINFDEFDAYHPYKLIVEKIKEMIKASNSLDISDSEALYHIYQILNNIILSAPAITQEDILLYRGQESYKNDLMTLNVGEIYVNQGIWSTSLDTYVAFKFAGGLKNKQEIDGYIIKILVPRIMTECAHKIKKVEFYQ